ncbi:MAG: M1 family metallopeptidase [Pedobacter sp.]|nr:M1 family metallopeptidase [Pedobacter sp.]
MKKQIHFLSGPCLGMFLLFILFSINVFADNYPRNYAIDIIHYSFDLQFSDSKDEMLGMASITIHFKKNDVKQVRLDLINQSEKWKGKGMSVQAVTSNGKLLAFTHLNDELLIQLATIPAANQFIIIVIQYKGIPAGGMKIAPTKYGDRSFMCENWPNNARHWLPTVDHPYDKATSEFIVTAPAHYQVISNGLLLEESLLNKETKRTHWKQSVPVSCWLFVLGIAEFAVQYVDQFQGKSIQTWVYPKDREAGFLDFATPTKQVLEFYTDYVGPFVYEKLASVETQSVSGGMETASAIFYDENMVTGTQSVRLRNVVIHEIAHQWFGNAVTETTWDDAWLSEGFATFFTLLFIENAYGYEEFIEGIKGARKTVYNLEKKEPTFSIVSNRTAEKEPVTSGITYQKGAWVLHMLREMIGHDNFRKAIQAYYQKYMNANATTNDFITEMEKASNKNLQTFFAQYLYRPDNLKLKGSWEYDAVSKQVIVKLQQTQSSGLLFDFPIEIAVYKAGAASPEIIKLNMNTLKAEFKMAADAKPALLGLDPRVVLLAEIDFK